MTLSAEGATDHRPRTRAAWQLKYLGLALIWGSSFLLMKFALVGMAPLQISTGRILAGALVVYALLRLRGGRMPRGLRVWGHFLVAGFFLAAFPFTCFAVGETRVSSALAGIGNSITPIVAVIFTIALLPSERVTRRKLAAVALGFAGVIVISAPWSAQHPDYLGFAITLAGGASYGVGWPYVRRFLGRADTGGFAQPAAVLSAGAVLMVPVLLAWWWTQRADLVAPWSLHADTSAAAWFAVLAVVVLGAVGTGLAYLLQFDVVRDAGAVVAATVTYLIPMVAVVLGVAVLRERLTFWELAGFTLVLAAALLVGRPEQGWMSLRRRSPSDLRSGARDLARSPVRR